MNESLRSNKKLPIYSGVFFCPLYIYIIKMAQEDKKIIPVVINHWKNKFERAIHILLDSGINPDELIEKIKIIENEKNN